MTDAIIKQRALVDRLAGRVARMGSKPGVVALRWRLVQEKAHLLRLELQHG